MLVLNQTETDQTKKNDKRSTFHTGWLVLKQKKNNANRLQPFPRRAVAVAPVSQVDGLRKEAQNLATQKEAKTSTGVQTGGAAPHGYVPFLFAPFWSVSLGVGGERGAQATEAAFSACFLRVLKGNPRTNMSASEYLLMVPTFDCF